MEGKGRANIWCTNFTTELTIVLYTIALGWVCGIKLSLAVANCCHFIISNAERRLGDWSDDASLLLS